MKKGLNVTLMTVAIAVMALQAMAMAPMIGDIKSPVVGNEGNATGSTPFVYPDAFDITAKATDDSTSPANIRWSYYYTGSEVYRINNVDRVGVSDAAIKEPGAARINGSSPDDPGAVDANKATITIRNVKYAPIGGGGSTPSGTIIDAMPVTLFASDGTTYSSKQVYFYTDNGGSDRLSGTANWTQVIPPVNTWPTSGSVNWAYAGFGSVTSTTSNNSSTAICFDCSAVGSNFAFYTSSWGLFSVAQNQVYRIRARINGSQATPGHTPFFDLVLGNNYGPEGFTLFGGDLMMLDNEGGRNAAIMDNVNNGTTYNWYWAPACLTNDAYNNNTTVWSAANAKHLKMYAQFRVMDINTAAGGALTADVDSGLLCLNELQIDSLPYSALSFAGPSDPGYFASPATLTTSNIQTMDVLGTVGIENGKVKISPLGSGTSGSANLTYGQANPGDGVTTPANGYADYADDYPVPWEADTLYKITWKWSAVDATSEGHPLDVIWAGLDTPSLEFIQNTYVTSQVAPGYPAMPKYNNGVPQDYIAFFYSHNVGSPAFVGRQRWRPRAEWANTPVLAGSTSTGSFYIHGWTVQKVSGQ